MRLASIDILRAITMVLMIWVNDFWTLTEVPKWLEHASHGEDYLGFSDIIFPLFLFIVGLSIPFAIDNRLAKKEGTVSIVKHILIRSLSLLIIGFFMVNYETAHSGSMLIGKYFWCLLMALAVVLIWINWKKSPVPQKWYIVLQVSGAMILVFLAVVYRGGEAGQNGMAPQWWGILGLIGWAYVLNALAYLFSRGNLFFIAFLWLVLNLLSVMDQTEMAMDPHGFLRYFSTIFSGTIPAFTTAGLLASMIYKRMRGSKMDRVYGILIVLGVLNIVYGLAVKPLWGISKLQGTPSWLAICTGMGFLLYVLIHYIADVKKHTGWAKIIAPAGTATLTCYMVPYFIYPISTLMGIRLPEFWNMGILGLFTSLVFSLSVVVFTGWLQRRGYSLKL
ncbi:MAG TPA: heparan-alpha-glucosaminide N-acetyltransferase domain-containing protein [Arenibacter sp.]|nr:heparan-alpha-glucosaminide N-acetyltransferase domain-containing protein [Arenibacter sp.]